MPITGQTYIDTVFASGGSVTQVPDAIQGDGSVSMTQGYGSNYTLPQGSPGSLNVEEVKMNYLFNLITTVLQQYQQSGIPPFIPAAATSNGSPYPYSQYSLALFTDGIAYISLVNSNLVLPGSDSTKWQPITLGTGILASQVYPVGSVYISMSVSTNPASILGFGTWVPLAGVALVGVGTGTDSNGHTQSFTAGTQVGEYVHTTTVGEMPAHSHTDSGHHHHTWSTGVAASQENVGSSSRSSPNDAGTSSTDSANIQNTGGGGSHNNVQPVIGAYMWYRSA